MTPWLSILLLTTAVCLVTSASIKAPAPSGSRDQLHHPLYRPTEPKTPQQHPRKGETCKNGVCTKLPPGPNGCPDCQYALPLDFTDDQFV